MEENMKIYPITDPLFARYGKVVEGYDLSGALEILKDCEKPEGGVKYVAEDARLQALPLTEKLGRNFFGGLPVQLGWCCGYNRSLNCLEYHRNSELNFATEDFILLLALESEIENGLLDTACVRAFLVPGNTLVELYATTLHYAPVDGVKGEGFRTGVALPRGTNLDIVKPEKIDEEDKFLFAANKWLLAHPESNEAKNGACVGLKGENFTL